MYWAVFQTVLSLRVDTPQHTVTSHQDHPLPQTAGTHSVECSVCSRHFVSKRGLGTHFGKMHKRNDTAFDDVASQRTEDTGDTESVATENSVGGIEDECTVASNCSATVAISQQVDV